MSRSKTSPPSVGKLENRRKAVQLRKAGFTYQEIADQIGMTRGNAYKLVAEAMQEFKTESAEEAQEVKRVELARLDHATRAIWSQVANGNHGAIDRLLRIMDRRAKLLGLDAPSKLAPTNPEGDQAYGGGGLAALLQAINNEQPSN